MHWGCFYTTNDSTNDVTGYKEWQRLTSFKYNATKKEYLLDADTKTISCGCGAEEGETAVKKKRETINYNKNQWKKIKFKDYVINDMF